MSTFLSKLAINVVIPGFGFNLKAKLEGDILFVKHDVVG